jgi:hypothetical protein
MRMMHAQGLAQIYRFSLLSKGYGHAAIKGDVGLARVARRCRFGPRQRRCLRRRLLQERRALGDAGAGVAGFVANALVPAVACSAHELCGLFSLARACRRCGLRADGGNACVRRLGRRRRRCDGSSARVRRLGRRRHRIWRRGWHLLTRSCRLRARPCRLCTNAQSRLVVRRWRRRGLARLCRPCRRCDLRAAPWLRAAAGAGATAAPHAPGGSVGGEAATRSATPYQRRERCAVQAAT